MSLHMSVSSCCMSLHMSVSLCCMSLHMSVRVACLYTCKDKGVSQIRIYAFMRICLLILWVLWSHEQPRYTLMRICLHIPRLPPPPNSSTLFPLLPPPPAFSPLSPLLPRDLHKHIRCSCSIHFCPYMCPYMCSYMCPYMCPHMCP